MAQYASFYLIMGPFKGEVPVFARLWPSRVRVRVSFTTGAVRSAILATAVLLVNFDVRTIWRSSSDYIYVAVGSVESDLQLARTSVCSLAAGWRVQDRGSWRLVVETDSYSSAQGMHMMVTLMRSIISSLHVDLYSNYQ